MSDTKPSDSLETLRKAARDFCILVAVIVLIAYPSIFGRFIHDARLEFTYDADKHAFTVKSEEETLKVANAVSTLQQDLLGAKSQIQQATAGHSDTALSAVSQTLDTLLARTQTASTAAAASLAAQQRQGDAADQPNAGKAGWLYLGKVDDASGQSWSGQPHIRSSTPVGLAGKTYEVAGNSFLHRDGAPPAGASSRGWRAAQPVIGVVKDGDSVQIGKTEINPATDGGYALWALINA